MFGPSPSGHVSACSVHHQYSSSVSPFQAKTGMPASAIAAAAWSWVEKMLQRRPADLGAERDERLDQHGGLDRHVQRAGDARALERLRVGELARAWTSGRASRARRAGSPCGRSRRARCRRPCSRSSWSVAVMRSPWGRVGRRRRAGAGASPARSAASRGAERRRGAAASASSQASVGLAQRRLAAQAQREGEVGEPDVVLVQQLAQRAQALELGRPVEAVAGRRAGGLDEPDALDVAQHARRPAGRLRRLVDRQRVHLAPV